jgi:hypothetical protein
MQAGDFVYLAYEITAPGCGDHPWFLMGRKGELVEILEVRDWPEYKYEVKGPTNPDKSWYARRADLMHTKPFSWN